jgi:putative mRNA 3-end processing factor
MAREPLIIPTDCGLYCPPGHFYIDAWRRVSRNIVTHAHSDHARRGSERYLAAAEGELLLRQRLGEIQLDAIPYGQTIDLNGVAVSLHPAGHVRGSAQVRVEYRGEAWVVTGDYKRQPDPTCANFELVRCHTLITECTFGLPIFRWGDAGATAAQINRWWRENRDAGRTSILLAYSLGKAQRVLANLDPAIGPILLHGAVHGVTEAYRQSGVDLPAADFASVENAKKHRGTAMVIAPPAAINSVWARKFAPFSSGMASGWMRVRGFRRRQGTDRGFVLSDHVDFPDLLKTIAETGAEHVIATHGYTDALVRLMQERGIQSSAIKTRFVGEEEAETETPESTEGEQSLDIADTGATGKGEATGEACPDASRDNAAGDAEAIGGENSDTAGSEDVTGHAAVDTSGEAARSVEGRAS